MPIRDFTDSTGVRWQVWATTPTHGNVRPQFTGGWLAFESADERRRLVPVPDAWTDADDGVLRELLAQAVAVARDTASVLKAAGPGGDPPPASETPLEATVARVREVIRAVEESLHREPVG